MRTRAAALLCLLSFPFSALALGSGQPPPPPPCPPPGYLVLEPPGFGISQPHWVCVQPPPRPTPVTGTLTPRVYPTHVVYSVPGRASAMAYVAGDVMGSSSSISTSFKNEANVQYDMKAGFLFVWGVFNIQAGQTTATSTGQGVDTTLTVTNGYRKVGEIDYVDHDDDEVWFVANPRLTATLTPASSYYGPAKTVVSFDPAQPGTEYFLYLGELRGTRAIPPEVQAALNGWGLTNVDMQALRDMDPFGYDVHADPRAFPERFAPVATFPYIPVSVAGYAPSVQTYAITRAARATTSKTLDVSIITSVTIGGNFAFGEMLKSTLTFSDKFTWTASSASKNFVEHNTSNTVSVGQPAFGYSGPTILRVYEDQVWGTFVFQLDRT